MKYRTAQLMAATSILTAGTTVLDIKSSDIISRITAIIKMTNNSWTPTGHPVVAMIKLELVDGSDVLHSLRGSYSEAMAFYGSGKVPYNNVEYSDNGNARASVPIYFGRRLWDPMFALDPKKFRNLQLKIQHNYALGGAAPDAATLEVWVDYFDENQPSPVGFMMAKSLWSKTLVVSTTDYVTLPTDYPIRILAPAAFSNVEEPDVNIDNFKVTEDGDKRVLIETDTMNHIRMIESQYPDFVEVMAGRTLTANAITYFCGPQKNLKIGYLPSEDVDSYTNRIWSGGGVAVLNGALTQTFEARVTGRCPFGVIPIPMGMLDEPDSWWDVTKVGSPKIKMVTGAGSTAALYELLVQQARSY